MVLTRERAHFRDDGGRQALVVDGVFVSVAALDGQCSGYWAAMMPDGAPRTALLLGLGGGTIAQMLVRRQPGIEIVGVDRDGEVVALAQEAHWLDLPGLRVVIGDAFSYVAQESRQFDFIAVDLFRGLAFERHALAKPFLRRLAAIARRDGEIVFNLFLDRRTERHVARIMKVLAVRNVQKAGKNVVVRCRRGSVKSGGGDNSQEER